MTSPTPLPKDYGLLETQSAPTYRADNGSIKINILNSYLDALLAALEMPNPRPENPCTLKMGSLHIDGYNYFTTAYYTN